MKKIKISIRKNQQPKAISLFSGAGGDTLGLERSAYDVCAFSELIPTFVRTHQANYPRSKLLEFNGDKNIRNIPDDVFTPYNGIVDLVFAGFPCQGFSHAGKKKENDPRNELVYEFIRVVKCIRPTWIIGENVSGLLSRKGTDPKSGRKSGVIDIIASSFKEIGYSLTWNVVTATYYGVPQKRKRLIIIGHDDSKISERTPYPHFDWKMASTQMEPCTSLRHILEDTLDCAMEFPKENIPSDINPKTWIITKLESPPADNAVHPNLIRLVSGIRSLTRSEKEAIDEAKSSKKGKGKDTDNGDDTEDTDDIKTIIVPKGLISFGSRSSGYHGEIVDPDQPSKTIICTYSSCPRLFVGLYNPDTDKYWIRTFTVTELAQIQSFPKDYQFVGNKKEIVTQIGNAVPPNIINVISSRLNTVCFKATGQNQSGEKIDNTEEEEEED
jgi:DNA (cytosine-5)-methyltransferase 1